MSHSNAGGGSQAMEKTRGASQQTQYGSQPMNLTSAAASQRTQYQTQPMDFTQTADADADYTVSRKYFL